MILNKINITNAEIDNYQIVEYLIEFRLDTLNTISKQDYYIIHNIIKFAESNNLDKCFIDNIKRRFNHFDF
jgi:hypothetical protein